MTEVKSLYWDEWNIRHIARHGVHKHDVGGAILDKKSVWSETYNYRNRVIGRTQKGRVLTIILFEKRRNMYYVVTARPASRKERKIYDQAKR